MIVECAACEIELDSRDGVFRLAGDEDREFFFCSQKCLRDFEENPEAYAFGSSDEDEQWSRGGGAAA